MPVFVLPEGNGQSETSTPNVAAQTPPGLGLQPLTPNARIRIPLTGAERLGIGFFAVQVVDEEGS